MPSHPKYQIDLICTDTCHDINSNEHLACLLCEKLSRHKDHTFDLMVNVTDKYKENLKHQIEKLDDNIKNTSELIVHLNDFTEEKASKLIDIISLEIKDHYDAIRRKINILENDIMIEAVQLIQNQMVEINNKKMELTNYIISSVDTSQKGNILMNNSSDYSLVLNYNKVISELNSINEKKIEFDNNKIRLCPLKIQSQKYFLDKILIL